LKFAELPGVLRGEALAEAYAGMGLFLFPSRTDTFGNVVQEAMASGAPAIVSNAGGPRFIVQHGVTGYVARSDEDFGHRVIELMENPAAVASMREACLRRAAQASWERVFEDVYTGYAAAIREMKTVKRGARLTRVPVG
jgi:glycosyltransferase involved in cell wall biosynthesis